MFIRLVFAWGMLVGSGGVAWAAKPPAGYVEMSGVQKREYHAANRNPNGKPSHLAVNVCMSALAGLGMVFSSYSKETLNSPSGLANTAWRKLFGKALHREGVVAPGEVTLKAPLLGLEPGTYPVTYRLSLANPYSTHLPGMWFRPGLLVMFHVDGKEDVNWFTMPQRGLDGFPVDINPFSVDMTHWLDLPDTMLQVISSLTLGRAAADVLTQYIDPPQNQVSGTRVREDSKVVFLVPTSEARAAYDGTWGTGFFERMMKMSVAERMPLYELCDEDDAILGNAVILDRWLFPSQVWFAQHRGFDTFRPN